MRKQAPQTAISTEEDILSLGEYKARQYLEDGKYHISEGDLDLAIECLQKSIEQEALSEAYTYLGWVLSLKEDYNSAIDLCLEAVKINPNCGTALNDIGNYLIQKGKHREAISWLEKAKNASENETPHFPYINLGRIYTSLGEYNSAISEFKKALELVPDHNEVLKVLKELEEIQNNA